MLALDKQLLSKSRRRGAGLAVVLFVVLGAYGGLGSAQPRDAYAQPERALAVSDIVLITVDALRADRLGSYGYKRRTSPNLDELSRSAIRFERAYTPTPHTSLAIGSLMTGRSLWTAIRLASERTYPTLPMLLRGAGFRSAAFYPPGVFFTEPTRLKPYESAHFGFDHAEVDYFDAKVGVQRTIEFLEQTHAQRAFVWLHLLEPHEPYELRPDYDFGPTASDRYDSEIAYVDAALGRLLEYLGRTRPQAAIVVTADHGEAFDEHGARYHGTSLYDEQVRIPLFIKLPGVPARIENAPVSLLDLLPTLLSLSGVTPPSTLRGRDLLRELGPSGAGQAVFGELLSLRMVVAGSHKLLCDITKGSCTLYDLTRDPGERRNRAKESQDTAAAMRAELDHWLRLEVEEFARQAVPADPRWSLLGRAQLGDRAVAEELAALLQPSVPLSLRRLAARWLADLPIPATAIKLFEQALHDRDPDTAGWAAVTGLSLRLKEARALGLRLLAKPSTPPALNTALALSLAEQGMHAAVPPLMSALPECTEPFRCQRVVRALGRLRDPRAVPALLGALPRIEIRREVVEALGEIADPATAQPLIDCLLGDAYVPVRVAAAHALSRLRVPQVAQALEQVIREETESIVVAAARRAVERLRRW